MRILQGHQQARFVNALEQRGTTDLADVESTVRRIINAVRRNGDRALRRYAAKLDGLQSQAPIRIPEAELKQAWEKTPADVKQAIIQAAANIRRYSEWQ